MSAEKSSQSRLRTELHLHLEGALTAARALALASAAKGVPSPPAGAVTGGGSEARWAYDDLGSFLRCFGWGTRLLVDEASYLLVFDDLVRSLRDDGVERAELFVAFGQMRRAGVDPRSILPGLARRAQEIDDEGGPTIHFIADATRQWGVREAERVLDAALDLQEQRIVGYSMGGDEWSLAAREFREIYRRARAAGLGLSCHAGEGTTAESVRSVVEELRVQRVGHGVAAVEDPQLLRELADEGIVLEVCPTSNRRTGVWSPDAGVHPVIPLIEAGVRVVVGSDDPAFFECSLSREAALLEEWGVDDEGFDRIERDACRARFANPLP